MCGQEKSENSAEIDRESAYSTLVSGGDPTVGPTYAALSSTDHS